MRTVHKFMFEHDILTIPLPLNATLRRFAVQDHGELNHFGSAPLYMWFELNTEEPRSNRQFSIFETGVRIPESAVYQGSAEQGLFVWHLYELV